MTGGLDVPAGDLGMYSNMRCDVKKRRMEMG